MLTDDFHSDKDMYKLLEMFDDNLHIVDNRQDNNNSPMEFVRNHEKCQWEKMVHECCMDQVWIWCKYRLVME